MNCKDFDEIVDSYLSDELSVETNHELIRHLTNCVGCRETLAERRELRSRIRSVARSSAVFSPVLATRVRSRLHEYGCTRPSRYLIPSFTFAGVVAVAALSLAFYIGRDTSPLPQALDLGIVQSAEHTDLIAALHDAIGNHKDCGLKFGNKAAEEITPEYTPLKSDFADLEFVEEHDCIFKGKKYSHVIFRSGAKLISVLKAPVDHSRGSDVIASTPMDNYQIAEFESGNRAVFVISDLSETENLQFARMILKHAKT